MLTWFSKWAAKQSDTDQCIWHGEDTESGRQHKFELQGGILEHLAYKMWNIYRLSFVPKFIYSSSHPFNQPYCYFSNDYQSADIVNLPRVFIYTLAWSFNDYTPQKSQGRQLLKGAIFVMMLGVIFHLMTPDVVFCL